MTATANQIVGSTLPSEHPALARLPWEHDITDVHGIACGHYDGLTTALDCYCGYTTGQQSDHAAALAELVEHAISTCALCQGPKSRDYFPRCSPHAF